MTRCCVQFPRPGQTRRHGMAVRFRTFENHGNCRFQNTFLFGGKLKPQRGCCLKGPRKLSNTQGRRDFTLLFLCVSVVKLIFRHVPTKIVEPNSSACVLCNMILFWTWLLWRACFFVLSCPTLVTLLMQPWTSPSFCSISKKLWVKQQQRHGHLTSTEHEGTTTI